MLRPRSVHTAHPQQSTVHVLAETCQNDLSWLAIKILKVSTISLVFKSWWLSQENIPPHAVDPKLTLCMFSVTIWWKQCALDPVLNMMSCFKKGMWVACEVWSCFTGQNQHYTTVCSSEGMWATCVPNSVFCCAVSTDGHNYARWGWFATYTSTHAFVSPTISIERIMRCSLEMDDTVISVFLWQYFEADAEHDYVRVAWYSIFKSTASQMLGWLRFLPARRVETVHSITKALLYCLKL